VRSLSTRGRLCCSLYYFRSTRQALWCQTAAWATPRRAALYATAGSIPRAGASVRPLCPRRSTHQYAMPTRAMRGFCHRFARPPRGRIKGTSGPLHDPPARVRFPPAQRAGLPRTASVDKSTGRLVDWRETVSSRQVATDRERRPLSTHGRKYDDGYISREDPGPPDRSETPRHTHAARVYPASPVPAGTPCAVSLQGVGPPVCGGRPGVRASRHRVPARRVGGARRPRGGPGVRRYVTVFSISSTKHHARSVKRFQKRATSASIIQLGK